jgi:hypothetical protein
VKALAVSRFSFRGARSASRRKHVSGGCNPAHEEEERVQHGAPPEAETTSRHSRMRLSKRLSLMRLATRWSSLHARRFIREGTPVDGRVASYCNMPSSAVGTFGADDETLRCFLPTLRTQVAHLPRSKKCHKRKSPPLSERRKLGIDS